MTRNTHINYAIKIKKIVNAYKSFIQKINNSFDKTGYQVLYLNTFREMLEIRDTISSPILMSENQDNTLTEFVIPTANNILYVLEIKIENYDEIYGLKEENIDVFEENTSNDNSEVATSNEVIIEEKNDKDITPNIVEKEITEHNQIVVEPKQNSNYCKPTIIIDNKGGHLLNVSIKTPHGNEQYIGNDKKKEINLNSKKANKE